ncbi:hypothetical protein B484DRAFT_394170 [Ochromonadaceae sp. CCMP2298]|nr:hypothetical protein B484DRAFT_394170 [Ochromonadaceae sp. CCMP2298]
MTDSPSPGKRAIKQEFEVTDLCSPPEKESNGGHDQNFCGHQQNWECWKLNHRCGVGECKCQCDDCQKDAAPESEPDVQESVCFLRAWQQESVGV